ncbi:MAG: hypothetical protein ACRD2X_18270 [Vicinamibacteraceae bacterium]
MRKSWLRVEVERRGVDQGVYYRAGSSHEPANAGLGFEIPARVRCRDVREDPLMTRRPERFVLFVLLLAGSVAAAYFLVTMELSLRSRQATAIKIQELTEQVRLLLVQVRAGQEAYIAEGQDAEDWMARVSDDLEALDGALDDLAERLPPNSTAVVDLEAARTAVDAFIVIDKRVREYVEAKNPLPASDLIFEDGMRTADAVDAHVTAARDSILASRAEADSERRQTMGAILGAWLFGLVAIALVLLRTGDQSSPEVDQKETTALATTGQNAAADDWLHAPMAAPPLALRTEPHATAGRARPGNLAPGSPHASTSQAPVQQVLPGVDLEIAAAVCTDLAQVNDAEELAEVAGRAARLLDASGLIVWAGDGEAAELRPLVVHGYTEAVAGEIPTIPFGADNVTAAAWRVGAARTVRATSTEPGGLAVPLLVASGCVGVLTAEIGHGREQDPATLAVARIVAAQIATLLPTPASVSSASAVTPPPDTTTADASEEDLFQT